MNAAIALFIFTLSAFGFCWAVGHSKLTLPLREALASPRELGGGVRWFVLTLMECPACLGFWTGAAAYVTHVAPPVFSSWYMAAFYVCGMNFILGKFTGLIVEE